LNDRENHRTRHQYDKALLFKSMSFKFINSYVSLYYIAFFKWNKEAGEPGCKNNDCLPDLQSQLFCFIVVRLVLSNLAEIIKPRLTLWWLHWTEDSEVRSLASGSQIQVYLALTQVEQQSKKEDLILFDEMEEQLLTFGYTTLFIVAAPWVPAVTLVGLLLECLLDKSKLLNLYRRPFPVNCKDNEPWDTAFEVMGILAMVTNVALVVFATDSFDGYDRTEKVKWFFILENTILAARAVVAAFLPSPPEHVRKLELKHAREVQKHLDCVQSTIDTSAMNVGRSGEPVIILERDDDDEDDVDA